MKGISTTEAKWWIGYNEDKSIIHGGYSPLGSQITIPLENCEDDFSSEEEWTARKIELGINN